MYIFGVFCWPAIYLGYSSIPSEMNRSLENEKSENDEEAAPLLEITWRTLIFQKETFFALMVNFLGIYNQRF